MHSMYHIASCLLFAHMLYAAEKPGEGAPKAVHAESDRKKMAALQYEQSYDSRITHCAFNPSGTLLACAALNKKLYVVDPASGKYIWNGPFQNTVSGLRFLTNTKFSIESHSALPFVVDLSQYASSSAVHGHGLLSPTVRLCAQSPTGGIAVWDKGNDEYAFAINHKDVISVAIDPQHKIAASGSKTTSTIKLWNIATPSSSSRTLTGHDSPVHALAFSADSAHLASGDARGSIALWNVAAHQHIATWQGHTNLITALTFNPHNRTLASASYDKTVKIWDILAHQNAEPAKK